MEWVAFYDSEGNELAAYTKRHEFLGERESTVELLAYERGVAISDIIVREEKRNERNTQIKN